MRASSYIIRVPVPNTDTTLLFHGYSGAVDLVSSRIAALLTESNPGKKSLERTLPADTLGHLLSRGYLTDRSLESEEAYVEALGERVHAVVRKHASPGFLVIPTYSCNLRCTYCYEKDLQARDRSWLEQRMSDEMVQAVFDAMEKIEESTRRQRCLTFYGGEPLQKSNQSVVRLLHEKACARGFRHFSAITNAIDLHHYADILGQERGFSFLQITLDGPPSVHNTRRRLPDGGDTFNRIARNVGLALNRGTRVSLRVNVDKTNVHRVKWLEDFFQRKSWTRHPLFRAYCSPVHGSVCGNHATDGFASHREMCRAIREQDKRGRKPEEPRSFEIDPVTHSVQKRILAHLSQEHGLPFWRTAFCGSNVAMHLFDPYGDIYPCWEVIGHAEYRIGRYGPGFVDLEPKSVRRWHHRSVVQIPACRSCAYLFFCGGGCEAFAFRTAGDPNQPSCSEFPGLFHTAALKAYREWSAQRKNETSLTEN